MSLVEFLRARLDDDAAEIAEHPDDWDDYAEIDAWRLRAEEESGYPSCRYLRIAKARALAEVEAKRKIVDEYVETIRIRDEVAARIRAAGDHPSEDDLDTWCRAQTEASIMFHALRHLAAPHAAHPDCWDEWKP